MNPDLIRRIKELEDWRESMNASSSIPLALDQAFRGRFPFIESDTKSSTSENQAVSEAGSASYNVLKAPDAFVKVMLGDTTYFIPVFK